MLTGMRALAIVPFLMMMGSTIGFLRVQRQSPPVAIYGYEVVRSYRVINQRQLPAVIKKQTVAA